MKLRKLVGLVLTLVMLVSMSSFEVVAAAAATPYSYEYEDGTIVEYYIDEDGNPYNTVGGEKYYVPIPLPQFMVTDSETLALIAPYLPPNPGISTRAVPSYDYDLTLGTYYSGTVSLANEEVIITPIFRVLNPKYDAIKFSTYDQTPFFGDHSIHLIFSLYNQITDEWQLQMIQNVDPSASQMFYPSMHTHVRCFFNRAYDLTSCTYSVGFDVGYPIYSAVTP
jgi:hypothetical protein